MSTEIIAEIGWNFMGDMGLSEAMIQSAKECGANIAKFQYWNPDKLKPGPWDEDGRIEIYRAAALTHSKIETLMYQCENAGIGFLVSAFNASDAALIADLGIRALKIPSHEVANTTLHRFAASHFSKVYVSLGAGTPQEVNMACDIYSENESLPWVGMHCVSSYPCAAQEANLPRLTYLRDKVKVLGYSDHTSDTVTPAISLAYGAKVIEKHFTVDNNLPGRDNKFALNPAKFSEMVSNVKLAEGAIIDHGPGPRSIESDTIENYRGRWGE